MRTRMRRAFGAIDPLKAEADIGILEAASSGAQAVVLVADDMDPSRAAQLKTRWMALVDRKNRLESARSQASDADWDKLKQQLLVEFEQLRVDAQVVLSDLRRKQQFAAALTGAAVGLAGALGLWLLMRKRKR